MACAALVAVLSLLTACGSDETPVTPLPDAEAPGVDAGTGGVDAGNGDGGADLPKCTDGVRNGEETDVDCGGGCLPCAQCMRCKVATDCETSQCADGTCGPAFQALPDLDPVRRALDNLVATIESGMRCDMDIYIDVVSVVGRESYRFSEKEAAYTSDLLGGGTSVLKSNAFYIVRPWESRYWVARRAGELQEEASAAAAIPESEKKGFIAFARTTMAYQLLLNLNLSDTNGLRDDVSGAGQPIEGKNEALAHIAKLLDDAKADLSTASFSFSLSSGFAGFTTPADFLKFNRALAARVAAYRQLWPEALASLNESFFNLNGDPSAGAYHRFSDAPGDLRNRLFVPQNSIGELRIAHPSFATDATPGDERMATKATLRTTAASQAGLAGNRDLWRYTSAAAPIPIIRNEELLLLYAEAQVHVSRFPDAVVAINRIRLTHNVPTYAGASTESALFNEILKQRRYSLFFEGHRWVDLRRYARLNELPIDRPGDDVWPAFPMPAK